MTIRNETVFKQEMIKGAMRAGNFDNSRYKIFKLIYNGFGLLFGIMMVSSLMPVLIGEEGADFTMVVIYGVAAGVLLFIGMYGMDMENNKRFAAIYQKMVGHTFCYEIDSDEIKVVDDDGDTDEILWKDIIKWKEDVENFYLFITPTEALILDKSKFTECNKEDLRQLATAVMALREEK